MLHCQESSRKLYFSCHQAGSKGNTNQGSLGQELSQGAWGRLCYRSVETDSPKSCQHWKTQTWFWDMLNCFFLSHQMALTRLAKMVPQMTPPHPHFLSLGTEVRGTIRLTLSIFPINVLPWPLSWPPQSSFSKLSWAEVFSGALLPSSSPSLPTEVVSLLPGMTSRSSLPTQGSLPTIRMASHRPSSLNPPCFLFSFPNSPRAQDPTF